MMRMNYGEPVTLQLHSHKDTPHHASCKQLFLKDKNRFKSARSSFTRGDGGDRITLTTRAAGINKTWKFLVAALSSLSVFVILFFCIDLDLKKNSACQSKSTNFNITQ